MEYTDDTIMPFGKYKGLKLGEVPADYLLFIYKEFEDLHYNFKKYLRMNKHILEMEVIAEKQKRRFENS